MAGAVFIVAAKRTPFGTFGGALKGISAIELSAIALRAALAEGKVDPSIVDSVVIGNVAQVRILPVCMYIHHNPLKEYVELWTLTVSFSY